MIKLSFRKRDKNPNLQNHEATLKNAYAYCGNMARRHYENFPVASFFLPKPLRKSIAVIYAFARVADDIADEGNFSAEERLAKLELFKTCLDSIQANDDFFSLIQQNENQKFIHNLTITEVKLIFLALQHVIKIYSLPITLFYDLLTAFRQDVTQTRYQTFEDILQYCRYSANPIGRLLLALNKAATPENLLLSDKICTGLQLINFMQDVDSDLNTRNRCYIPLDDLSQFQITVDQLKNYDVSIQNQAKHLLLFQLERIQQLYDSGKPLSKYLKGLFGFEIRLIISGGQDILNQLKTRESIYQRPKLKLLGLLKNYSVIASAAKQSKDH